jgi:hypothetical protein
MKSLISLKMEVSIWRVIATLLAIPVAIIGLALSASLVMLCLGYEDKTLRIGMSPEQVRKVLGDPDHVASFELTDGTLQEDWWYSQPRVQQQADLHQLTFKSGLLTTNHSKNHLPQ